MPCTCIISLPQWCNWGTSFGASVRLKFKSIQWGSLLVLCVLWHWTTVQCYTANNVARKFTPLHCLWLSCASPNNPFLYQCLQTLIPCTIFTVLSCPKCYRVGIGKKNLIVCSMHVSSCPIFCRCRSSFHCTDTVGLFGCTILRLPTHLLRNMTLSLESLHNCK